jgi:hypothetical protein
MKTHCLQLETTLSLDIDVDVERSVADTRDLARPGRKDFVFAVGELFVRHNDRRHLISGDSNTGNLIGVLERMIQSLRAAIPLPRPFAQFSKLGPCAWLLSYWARIDAETVSPEDEVLYDLLSRYCVIAEGNGCIAIYKKSEQTMLQVCARESTVSVPLCYEVHLDPAPTAARIERILLLIKADITRILTAH